MNGSPFLPPRPLRRAAPAPPRVAPPGKQLARVLVPCVGLLVAAPAACTRAPLDTPCPQLEVGALVITELRGPQAGADTYGEWLEIYNASDSEIDLGGLAVTSIELDGSGEDRFLVRASALRLAPGAYATLGATERDPLPSFVDYSFALDGVTGLKVRGLVTLESCGAFVDEVVYRDLPAEGSLALDGSQPPTAERNDDESLWCADTRPPDPGAPMIELGVPGTPREENPACVP